MHISCVTFCSAVMVMLRHSGKLERQVAVIKKQCAYDHSMAAL